MENVVAVTTPIERAALDDPEQMRTRVTALLRKALEEAGPADRARCFVTEEFFSDTLTLHIEVETASPPSS